MNVLPSISEFFKSELKNVLNEGHYNEIVEEIESLSMPKMPYYDKPYTITLECENFEEQSMRYSYRIDVKTNKPGKIFRISAQNQRYKTTALLIIAVLLGYFIDDKEDSMVQNLSFEDKKEILSNDRLLQRLNNLVNVIFKIENDDEIESYNRQINLIIHNEELQILSINVNNDCIKIISEVNQFNICIDLASSSCYSKYLECVNQLNLFTPHVISKGRNFVKFILVDETKKYWYSLNTLFERLKNKHVKWSQNINTLTIDEIEKRIAAIKILKRAEAQFPYYFKYRKKYKKYLNLENIVKDMSSPPDKKIFQSQKLILEEKKQRKQEIILSLEAGIKEISTQLSKFFGGNSKYQFEQIERTYSGLSITESLPLQIPNSKDLSVIRAFRITWEENNQLYSEDITNLDSFYTTLLKLDELQKKYYTGSVLFNDFREEWHKQIVDAEILREEILIEEDRLKELQNILSIYEEFNELKNDLGDVVPYLKEVKEHQIRLIDSKIIEAGISDQIDLDVELDKLQSLLKSDNAYNPGPLGYFLDNLYDAYQIFGREVSDMSKRMNNPNSSISISKNELLMKLISVFEKDILKRCPYYFKANSNGVKSFDVIKYDFFERAFYSNEDDLLDLRIGISGGTDSAMTVLSLASSINNSLFGNVLLIDEWGDVSYSFHNEVINKLKNVEQFAFGFFVDVDDRHGFINTETEGD